MDSNELILIAVPIVGIVAIVAVMFPDSKFAKVIHQYPEGETRREIKDLILFAGALIFGVLLLFKGGRAIYFGCETLSWPEARGTITSSEKVIAGHIYERRTSEWPVYAPKISYSYVIRDVTYSSSRVLIGLMPSVFSKSPESRLKKYPVGTKVTVYFNPANPNKAVLEKGVGLNAIIQVGLGTLLLAIAALLSRSIKQSRIRRET